MKTEPLPVKIINPDFPATATASVSPGSESIVIIDFKETDGGTLCSAVLLPAHTEQTIRTEPGTAFYSIFFPGGEVEIKFGWHVDTIAGVYTMLAFITTRSVDGMTITTLHGL